MYIVTLKTATGYISVINVSYNINTHQCSYSRQKMERNAKSDLGGTINQVRGVRDVPVDVKAEHF